MGKLLTQIYSFSVHKPAQTYFFGMGMLMDAFGRWIQVINARIKLSNYPSYEFGHLEGVVAKLTEIPNENSYQIEITLNNGMTSSYNKLLIFTPEMTGTAEIVTDNLRVMQRIFNQFNKLYRNLIFSDFYV